MSSQLNDDKLSDNLINNIDYNNEDTSININSELAKILKKI